MHVMELKEHWETVYGYKQDHEVSWFREHLENSLKLIIGTGVEHSAAIIDVGGGSSTLIDDLLKEGYTDVTVLDISSTALDRSKKRLGAQADIVNWMIADITEVQLPVSRYDVWHDRAVFHFLTNEKDRKSYIDLVSRAVKPGGHVIIASFGTGGPQKCSGLDVVRYSPESMHAEFGQRFKPVKHLLEGHETPFGKKQEFVYCYFRQMDGSE